MPTCHKYATIVKRRKNKRTKKKGLYIYAFTRLFMRIVNFRAPVGVRLYLYSCACMLFAYINIRKSTQAHEYTYRRRHTGARKFTIRINKRVNAYIYKSFFFLLLFFLLFTLGIFVTCMQLCYLLAIPFLTGSQTWLSPSHNLLTCSMY